MFSDMISLFLATNGGLGLCSWIFVIVLETKRIFIPLMFLLRVPDKTSNNLLIWLNNGTFKRKNSISYFFFLFLDFCCKKDYGS